ncbi:MAG: hypothetical protein ABW185_02850 [Sedimenticola sp.]
MGSGRLGRRSGALTAMNVAQAVQTPITLGAGLLRVDPGPVG